MDIDRLKELAGTTKSEIKESVFKATDGQDMGASDMGPPEMYDEEVLSRVSDMLYHAEQIGMAKQVFASLPTDLKTEWNYSKWTYRAERGSE